MRFHILVGANVIDSNAYTKYRNSMLPILKQQGGEFLYDFDARPLPSGSLGQSYNRVFVISFPDEAAKQQFFEDPEYRQVREELLVPSVADIETLSYWNA